MVRKIIKIDESKCNGCGLCAAACHEGAIGMVNGKAKLLREDYCDGLGDCLPACPTGAITFEEREAPAYDHAAVLAAKLKNSSLPMIGAGIVGIVCFVGMTLVPASAAVLWPVMILTIVASMAVYFFRALYYATVDESGTPKNVVGSVIGIASLIGFLPDTFYTSLCGKWLEADPTGTSGYQKIFIAACCAMVLGLVCSFLAERLIKKYRSSASASAK